MTTEINGDVKKKAIERLYELLALQKDTANQFGETDYNVFVFGSYLTTRYVGKNWRKLRRG